MHRCGECAGCQMLSGPGCGNCAFCKTSEYWLWLMVFSSIMLPWTLTCSFQATSAVRTVAQPRLARTASWCSRAPRTQRRGRRARTTRVVGRWRRRRADVESVRAARWTSEDFVKCDRLVDRTATYYVTKYRATYDILKVTHYKVTCDLLCDILK